MSSRRQAPPIDVDGVHRYDGWRRHWRTGAHSQAVGMLCHHGMARALALIAPPGAPPPAPAPVGPAPDTPPLSDCPTLTRAAARMIHELLVREAGERRHA